MSKRTKIRLSLAVSYLGFSYIIWPLDLWRFVVALVAYYAALRWIDDLLGLLEGRRVWTHPERDDRL